MMHRTENQAFFRDPVTQRTSSAIVQPLRLPYYTSSSVQIQLLFSPAVSKSKQRGLEPERKWWQIHSCMPPQTKMIQLHFPVAPWKWYCHKAHLIKVSSFIPKESMHVPCDECLSHFISSHCISLTLAGFLKNLIRHWNLTVTLTAVTQTSRHLVGVWPPHRASRARDQTVGFFSGRVWRQKDADHFGATFFGGWYSWRWMIFVIFEFVVRKWYDDTNKWVGS